MLRWAINKIKPYGIKDYISCESIAKNLFSDTDIYTWLNNEYQDINEDNYSKKILTQLLSRNFLKPLWKSIFEYHTFMESNFSDRQRKAITVFLTGGRTKEEREVVDKNRRDIVKKIQEKSDISPGDIFLIERSNKFYASSALAEFYVKVSGNEVELKRLIPMRNFDETVSNIAFYIFAPQHKIDQVKKDFIDIIKSEI